MPTTTLQSARLVKRTAWMQMQQLEKPHDPDTDEEKRLAQIAVRMLNYVACLNYAMDDLEADLRQTSRLCGLTARCFNISRRIVIQAHEKAYRMLVKITPRIGREYNDVTDTTWQLIDEHVLIQSPERGYNIVVALCRLVERLNRELGMRYYFQPAQAIATIPAKLDGVNIQDYKIDRIIEMATIWR